jgi:hypothetical protein
MVCEKPVFEKIEKEVNVVQVYYIRIPNFLRDILLKIWG